MLRDSYDWLIVALTEYQLYRVVQLWVETVGRPFDNCQSCWLYGLILSGHRIFLKADEAIQIEARQNDFASWSTGRHKL